MIGGSLVFIADVFFVFIKSVMGECYISLHVHILNCESSSIFEHAVTIFYQSVRNGALIFILLQVPYVRCCNITFHVFFTGRKSRY
jgi:hypothetical protein